MSDKKLYTIHLVTSRSMNATDEERMPFITKEGKKTFEESEAITSEDFNYLDSLAMSFGLHQHQYKVDVL